MPRDGAIIFADLIGKLDLWASELNVAIAKANGANVTKMDRKA